IIIYDRPSQLGRLCNRLVGVVHDYFFPKSIDEMLEPATYFYSERMERCKLNGITEQVAPKSAVGTDHKRIMLVQFNIIQSDGMRVVLAVFFDGHEFIKCSV